MSLYDLEEPSDLYGFNQLELTNPIQYLLSRVQIKDNPKTTSDFSKEVSDTSKELNNVVKSKFNLFKGNEAQSVDGSGAKKRFTFARKK